MDYATANNKVFSTVYSMAEDTGIDITQMLAHTGIEDAASHACVNQAVQEVLKDDSISIKSWRWGELKLQTNAQTAALLRFDINNVQQKLNQWLQQNSHPYQIRTLQVVVTKIG